HSSIRQELTRTFGATLVVLVTVVMTMTLIRTLGEASRGTFNPADVMIIMGYTVLHDMPTILVTCLFIAVLLVLNRMFRDSEMVIWFGSGRGLTSLLNPLFRFAWPILVVVLTLSFFILPWAYGRIEDLRDKYEKRGDVARIQPGQFQESANGDRVFFFEKDPLNRQAGNNVFISTKESGKEAITSAKTGRFEVIGPSRFLVLDQGQRLERAADGSNLSISVFQAYGAKVGSDDTSARSYVPTNVKTTWELMQAPDNRNLAELSWRAGLTLAACNFVVFVLYINLLVLGKSWIEAGQVGLPLFLVALHGGVLCLSVMWLLKRNNHWTWRGPSRCKTSPSTGDGR
ncbi:MAG: LPS export ABC transporter permease LptF, partial [Burkholderiales bacterium PBB4]